VIGAHLSELAPGVPPDMTSHEEPDGPRSQDSFTGGAGGLAVSHAWSAVISGPGFFLDLGRPGRW